MTAATPDLALPFLDDAGRALLFTEARTANAFAPTPVGDEQLSEIWELAKWGPTSANTQPLRVVYVRSPEARDRLLPLMAEGNRAKTASAPAIALLAVDTEFHEHIPTVMPYRPEMREVFAGNDAHRERTGQFNAALQTGYFILSVRAHGLAAGPMSGFDARAVDAEFFPGGRFRSVLVVNIGHPAENAWFGRLPRLDHATVVEFV